MTKFRVGKAKRPWQEIAKEVQDYRDASVARVKPHLPDIGSPLLKNVLHIPFQTLSKTELQITEAPVEEILSTLASGGVTAIAVTEAYLRRAGLAQKLVCLERRSTIMSMPTLRAGQLRDRAAS